ncbi:MAG TPA: leucine-rich repeat domain-containing protein, partial [Candidatus Hydrogenedentes bacterium]|nr:leucine-rich repeat domain-containing protein [Candidatus Hydrogenedentota bacterium]
MWTRQALLTVSLAFVVAAGTAHGADVTFTDAALEQAIRDVFNDNGWTLSTPPQDTELSRPDFTQLDASELGITDLTGIEACTSLEELNLGLNQISDLTPLSGLTALTWLDLGLGANPFESDVEFDPFQTGMNLVSDISPLGGLTNLEYLSLMGNDLLTDISPIASMSSLSELWLASNPISDFSPLSSRAATLLVLAVMNNGVQDSDIATINTLTNLQGLVLIAELGVTDISGLTAINPGFLVLYGAPGVTDATVVESYTNLSTLILGGTAITVLPDLSGLSNVEHVECGENPQLTDIAGVASATTVKRLFLPQCQISDISATQGLTNLEELMLQENQITDIQALVDNPGLGGGDHVVLLNNPLSQDAACIQLPALRAKFSSPFNVESNAVCGDVYTLTINVVGTGTTWPNPGTTPFEQGETAQINAETIAGSGYAFSHWEGDASGTDQNIGVLMDGDKTVTAVFVTPGDYTLTMIKVGGGSDFMSPQAGVHAVLADRTVNLTANPGPGRYWGGWSGDVTSFNFGEQIIMDGNKTVTGTFADSGYELTT